MPEKWHILFLTHYFPPEGNAPASRVYALGRQWAQAGHRVTVITCAPNVPDGRVYEGYRNRLMQRETIDGIDVIRVWTYIAPNEGTARRIANYVSYMLAATLRALFVRRPDVVIATSPQFFCGWAGVLVHWLKRVPFVLEIRDIWPESIVAVGAMRQKRLLRTLEWLELKMYAAADHIVTVGDGYRERLLERGVPADRISVITNGVDRDLFSPRVPDAALRHKHGLEGKFVCSYIGTIGMASGLEVVLEAARLLRQRGRPDIQFLLVGDGAIRAGLQAQVEREGLDSVKLVGRQPKELIPAYLSVSDCCLVHLKRTDLFRTVLPSKIFEALAMQRPIVLGVEGQAAELLEQADGGLCIEPENAAQLVEAVLRFADDERLRRHCGRSGHEFVMTHYDRGRLALDYLDLLERFARNAANATAEKIR